MLFIGCSSTEYTSIRLIDSSSTWTFDSVSTNNDIVDNNGNNSNKNNGNDNDVNYNNNSQQTVGPVNRSGHFDLPHPCCSEHSERVCVRHYHEGCPTTRR
jgi:hypothetical protein